MIELKSAEEIDRMAVTGRFVGELLAELRGVAAVGVNLMDLEHHARRRISERGAESCYWDYSPSFGRGPFRNVLCLSVNDAVLHGLPHDYVLRDGDLLSIDMAVGIDGWVADSALSVIVGTPDPADLKLDRGHRGRTGGRHHRRPARRPPRRHLRRDRRGRPLLRLPASTTSSAATASAAPCTRPRTSPTTAAPGRGIRLMPGLTIAIEPWFCRSTDKIRYDGDGWTIRSADGSRTAHSEHTVAITAAGPRVLTRRPAEGASAGSAGIPATA